MSDVNGSTSIPRMVFRACTYPFRAAWSAVKYVGRSVSKAVEPIRVILAGKNKAEGDAPKTDLDRRGVTPVPKPSQGGQPSRPTTHNPPDDDWGWDDDPESFKPQPQIHRYQPPARSPSPEPRRAAPTHDHPPVPQVPKFDEFDGDWVATFQSTDDPQKGLQAPLKPAVTPAPVPAPAGTRFLKPNDSEGLKSSSGRGVPAGNPFQQSQAVTNYQKARIEVVTYLQEYYLSVEPEKLTELLKDIPQGEWGKQSLREDLVIFLKMERYGSKLPYASFAQIYSQRLLDRKIDSTSVRELTEGWNEYKAFQASHELQKLVMNKPSSEKRSNKITFGQQSQPVGGGKSSRDRTTARQPEAQPGQPNPQLIPKIGNLDQVYQGLQEVRSVGKPHYDQPLTEELFAHGETNVTYEAELARVNQATDEMAVFMTPEEYIRQKSNNEILQKYRFGIIPSREEAWRQLTNGVPSTQWRDLDGQLRGTTPVRPTKLSQEEVRELGVYRRAVQELYETQSHGNSNCQSFANSMEHFMRGLGYQQVVGVMQQLDMNVKVGDPTPVACWNLPKYQAGNFSSFLEGLYDFRAAAAEGMAKQPNPANDGPAALNGSRYILLKTSKEGGGGHVLYMVRSKATGRFIIIDGQSRQVYPLLHPDGTYTDEAKDILGGRNIYTLRVDNISDKDFKADLKRSNDLMKTANKAAEVTMVVERFLPEMPAEGWQSIQAGVNWLYDMHVRQHNYEMDEYQGRLNDLRRRTQDESALVEPTLCQKNKMMEEVRRVCSDEEWRAMRNNYLAVLQKDLTSMKEALGKTKVVHQQEMRHLIDHFADIPVAFHGPTAIPQAAEFLTQFTHLGKDEIAQELVSMFGSNTGWKEFWLNMKSNAYDRFIKAMQGIVRH
ncbi:hypothetical protein M3P05_01630 [Sansalvadorimonas sp. 2012CJ34-2]|uniref:Uncharacterized protein n=1 Tax=Parendozoicomonas callyspongiae TaxID=2942213 RepID=A0ABT0PB94_9GAMM|nr:hypothetical protein [Sansalvadorimonas sp. 2012CJ34-2]MCL6268653.1 hypothetical protein [Sansalvadorimonas sp. 2012CJ34-2]